MIEEDPFEASRLKIKRADKHIRDLAKMLEDFSLSEFYSVSVQLYRDANHLRFTVDRSRFSPITAALVIGDVLHNLRSALDLAYFRAVWEATETWCKHPFPIRHERKEVENSINGGLKKRVGSAVLCSLILDVIKPYQAGNYPLWALHELNIRDKHQLVIPVLQLMQFSGIRLENDEHAILEVPPCVIDESSLIRLPWKGNLTVKDKGHAAANIIFDVGIPFDSQSVIKALQNISEVIACTIEAIEIAVS